MRITILTVGKLKEKYLKSGIDEFAKRLSKYCKLEMIEVPDEKAPENLSPAEENIIRDKEAEKLMKYIKSDAYVVALAIDGKMYSSEGMATWMQNLGVQGKSHIVFVIGGSIGIGDEIYQRANEKFSFSKMTFPHQMMRLILLEQVYRSFRINSGEPYHK